MRTGKRLGFTLVELLVVITIIGILIGLLLPAVQSAREAARQLQCKNNLYQIGRASLMHVETHGFYPSSGWGYLWTGDPDMGFGSRQPGGFFYNLLPYLEQQAIHQLGAGLSDSAKRAALSQQKSTVVPLFHCPSRRRAIAYPAKESSVNADQPGTLAKTDYAANGGSYRFLGAGPTTGCLNTFPDCEPLSGKDTNWPTDDDLEKYFNGISCVRSEIQPAHIRDGTSNTYLVGEKYLDVDRYLTGNDGADNNSAYQGNDWDTNRWASSAWTPRQDREAYDFTSSRFGSAHSGSLNMVFCDGSVHSISYSIDPSVHGYLGSRRDGESIPGDTFR